MGANKKGTQLANKLKPFIVAVSPGGFEPPTH